MGDWKTRVVGEYPERPALRECPDCGARISEGVKPGWHAVRLVRKGSDVVLVNCAGKPAGDTEAGLG